MINKPMTKRDADLKKLREKIDSLDETMHQLLIERSAVIEQLIKVKGTAQSGSAFRPAREVQVLNQRALQHKGGLPFNTIENIWRVIIATFTFQQAAFSVHGDTHLDKNLMQDIARFNFGFTVPYSPHPDTNATIHAVMVSKGDLGLIPCEEQPSYPWWTKLYDPPAPKIIAQLPFVIHDTCFKNPVYIIANINEKKEKDCQYFYALDFKKNTDKNIITEHLKSKDLILQSWCNTTNHLSCLVTSQKYREDDQLTVHLKQGTDFLLHISEIGSSPKQLIIS